MRLEGLDAEIFDKNLNHELTDDEIKEVRKWALGNNSNISKQYTVDQIKQVLDSFSSLKVIVIGEGILDEYHYTDPLGKSGKSSIITHKYLSHETHVGGAFIVANNVANVCNEIHFVTMLGDRDTYEEFITNHLDHKIKPKFFYKPDSPTIRKKRYISNNQKLFEINYLNDTPIPKHLETEIINYLTPIIQNYDIVIVSDFGHGFITPKIINFLQINAKKLAVNVQTNSANSGFNLVTRYKSPSFVCINETEARLATQSKFEPIEQVLRKLWRHFDPVVNEMLVITLSKEGSIAISRHGIVKSPALLTTTIDTLGTGDAFFVFSSLCFAIDAEPEMISYIGNIAGALASQIVGNRKSIKKGDILDFMCHNSLGVE